MATLETRLRDLATAIGTAVKASKTLINGNVADLTGLTTTVKTNLVAAVNEVVASVAGKQATLGFTPENAANKGIAGGYAPLDGSAKISATYLPAYVDDVLEYANFAALPAVGETGKIYITLATDLQYRWSGSTYIQLVSAPGSTDAVPEGVTNLYFTNARVDAELTVKLGTYDTDYAGVFTAALT